MKLETFGRARLESGFSRPKPLLMLAYIALEGPQERRRLAELFWTEGETQKRLGQLSVVLNQLKKEGGAGIIPDKAGLDPIPVRLKCDAVEFVELMEQGQLEQALELYSGSFLHDLGKPLVDLEVSPELLDWILEQREVLAQKAQSALLQLAEAQLSKGDRREARTLAERAYSLPDAPQMEPATLSRLQHLLAQTGSSLASNLETDLKTGFEDLSPTAQQVFLALALQTQPNLTITRNALKLSIGDISEARGELILGGFISSSTAVLAGEMALRWLEQHPTERVPLLLSLARSTPPEQAFALYRQIHQSTHGFGGAGDFPRARTAYLAQAQTLMNGLKFAETLEVLGELRAAEQVAEADPEPQVRFLEAYALERLGRFKEALVLTADIPEAQHTPSMVALRSVLLWRTGKSHEARAAAEQAVQSGLDWLWAKATANNTLGYLAHSEERFLDAASSFKKAASLYLTAGEKNRWVGSLNNHAMALDELAQLAEKEGQSAERLEALQANAEQAYQQTLQALEQTGDNPTLRARILLNIGLLWQRRTQLDKAEEYFVEAHEHAERANTLEISARLHLNLGMVYLGQEKIDEAREQFSKAISCAAQAGEFVIQGRAVGNIAFLDNDPDGIEVAIDLLRQSNHADALAVYIKDYETVLARNIEKSLQENNPSKAHRLLGKLDELYSLLGIADKSERVGSAQRALRSINDTRPVKDLLFSLIGPSKWA
ncbi:MAG: tetratricopeptide repeat protein [Meiothermus sp.]|nr:tetratricopeptide repeat protein [Meiothermus sp.]